MNDGKDLLNKYGPWALVDVTACCPAVVNTPHFLSDSHDPKGPTPLSKEPAEVARAAIQGLGRKRSS